jgi:hypothetical protein
MGGESRECSIYLSQLMNRRSPFAACAILTVLLVHLSSGVIRGNDQNLFVLKKDGKINAQIDNRPLNQTLRELTAKLSIDLKGISVGSEPVNLSLSEVSLEELLKKMMRGYNYVLVKPDKSDRLTLMVLSRADRTKYVDSPAPAASAPPPIPQPVTQAVPATPPRPQQTRGPSSVPARPGSGALPGPQSGALAGPQSGFSSGSPQSDPMTPPMPSPVTGLSNDMYPPMPPGFAVGGGASLPAASPAPIAPTGQTTPTTTQPVTAQPIITQPGPQPILTPPPIPTTTTPVPADPGPPPQIPNVPGT